VAELIEVIGEAAYMQLASAVGGASFYVPRHPGADHFITRAIGPEKAALVGEYFHGQNLVLSLRDWRRRAILSLADRHSGDQIAAQLRISRSYVYDVLATAQRARDPGLFD
jgi:hypothetical protein